MIFGCFTLNQEQYEFLHDALVEAILAGNTTVSPIDFLPKLEELQKINPNTGVTGLKEQFDVSHDTLY